MARRKKRKKNKKIHILSAKQVGDAVKRNWARIVLTIGCLAILTFVGFSFTSFLAASEYFNISEIEVVDSDPEKVDYPLARINDETNIFNIDLKGIAENIEREYYDIQQATVKRVLPNKLVIEVLRRRPVAQIAVGINRKSRKKHYMFLVNKDAYIISNLGTRAKRGLPVIYGAGLSVDSIEIGHINLTPRLRCALEFLQKLKESGFDKKHKITRLDVYDVRSMAFFIGDTLEVKIGDRKWDERLANLGGILQNMDINYSEEYYVDVRFKDFVFGKKEE